MAAVQKCHFAYYEQGEKHFFILEHFPSQGELVAVGEEMDEK